MRKNTRVFFIDIETHRSPASLTVNELAEFAGLRREVFSRNFTHALGMTPKEYLVRHLMSKASSLLLNPNMSFQI